VQIVAGFANRICRFESAKRRFRNSRFRGLLLVAVNVCVYVVCVCVFVCLCVCVFVCLCVCVFVVESL